VKSLYGQEREEFELTEATSTLCLPERLLKKQSNLFKQKAYEERVSNLKAASVSDGKTEH